MAFARLAWMHHPKYIFCNKSNEYSGEDDNRGGRTRDTDVDLGVCSVCFSRSMAIKSSLRFTSRTPQSIHVKMTPVGTTVPWSIFGWDELDRISVKNGILSFGRSSYPPKYIFRSKSKNDSADEHRGCRTRARGGYVDCVYFPYRCSKAIFLFHIAPITIAIRHPTR